MSRAPHPPPWSATVSIMNLTRASALVALLVVAAPLAPMLQAQPLTTASVHLGVAGRPEWEAFRRQRPDAESLVLTFEAERNPGEHTLVIRQADVKQEWRVELNGALLGTLVRMEADLVHTLPVAAGALRSGTNTLRITSKTPEDDVVVHAIRLEPIPMATLLGTSTLQVHVTGTDGQPLPARVTVVDRDGALAALRALPGVAQAVRPGVAYAAAGPVTVGLLPGTYRVRATRGPEYGMHESMVSVRPGETRAVTLQLVREVPTKGWVAADTHIHTLELSGHGDASVAERALTLAGEGVELAIATEHNREADYGPALAAMGVDRHLTPVSGSEVTTATGHFNVFPASGAVAILNHPHDAHSAFTPFARANFNAATGASRGTARTFTAMEVVNSGAMRSDWMEPIRSWFALLNRGLRITPVGASDSHDVSRFIVGQGRTYIRVADQDPSRISVADAVHAVAAGRVVVSLGLFAQANVGTAGPGDLVTSPRPATIAATLSGPTWMKADRLALYVNGTETAHVAIEAGNSGRVEKASVAWPLPARRHDYHVVVIGSGPGVTDASWAIPRPYQPTSPAWAPIVFALTAPIYVDADGDGAFTSARVYATRLVDTYTDVGDLCRALAEHDPVVSSHAAELLESRGVNLDGEAVRIAVAAAARPVQDGWAAYHAAR